MTCISTITSSNGAYLNGDSTSVMGDGCGTQPSSTLPEPSDAISRMLMTGDYGSSMAAMLMLSQKEQHENAKNARDSAYQAVENAQRIQIDDMKDAAELKFATGIAQGSCQLGSAGLSLASVKPGVDAQTADYQLRGLPQGTSPAVRNNLVQAAASGKTHTEQLAGTAKGLDGFATVVGAGGKLVSDAADREVTGDEQRVTTLQRIASDHASDADEAQKAIEKTVDLFHEYLNVRNATLLAATQRA
jgi:hypothetical protein